MESERKASILYCCSMARNPVKFCVVDAFTDQAFKGNPAAVCLLEDEKDEEWLQSVATEFNISETCYLTRIADSESQSTTPRFKLRWFTPIAEVSAPGPAAGGSVILVHTK